MVKKIKLLYANKLYKKLSGSICSKYPLKNVVKITPDIYNVDIGGYLFSYGRLQQLIEFFGQVTKEDLEWRFPPQTFPGTPI